MDEERKKTAATTMTASSRSWAPDGPAEAPIGYSNRAQPSMDSWYNRLKNLRDNANKRIERDEEDVNVAEVKAQSVEKKISTLTARCEKRSQTEEKDLYGVTLVHSPSDSEEASSEITRSEFLSGTTAASSQSASTRNTPKRYHGHEGGHKSADVKFATIKQARQKVLEDQPAAIQQMQKKIGDRKHNGDASRVIEGECGSIRDSVSDLPATCLPVKDLAPMKQKQDLLAHLPNRILSRSKAPESKTSVTEGKVTANPSEPQPATEDSLCRNLGSLKMPSPFPKSTVETMMFQPSEVPTPLHKLLGLCRPQQAIIALADDKYGGLMYGITEKESETAQKDPDVFLKGREVISATFAKSGGKKYKVTYRDDGVEHSKTTKPAEKTGAQEHWGALANHVTDGTPVWAAKPTLPRTWLDSLGFHAKYPGLSSLGRTRHAMIALADENYDGDVAQITEDELTDIKRWASNGFPYDGEESKPTSGCVDAEVLKQETIATTEKATVEDVAGADRSKTKTIADSEEPQVAVVEEATRCKESAPLRESWNKTATQDATGGWQQPDSLPDCWGETAVAERFTAEEAVESWREFARNPGCSQQTSNFNEPTEAAESWELPSPLPGWWNKIVTPKAPTRAAAEWEWLPLGRFDKEVRPVDAPSTSIQDEQRDRPKLNKSDILAQHETQCRRSEGKRREFENRKWEWGVLYLIGILSMTWIVANIASDAVLYAVAKAPGLTSMLIFALALPMGFSAATVATFDICLLLLLLLSPQDDWGQDKIRKEIWLFPSHQVMGFPERENGVSEMTCGFANRLSPQIAQARKCLLRLFDTVLWLSDTVKAKCHKTLEVYKSKQGKVAHLAFVMGFAVCILVVDMIGFNHSAVVAKLALLLITILGVRNLYQIVKADMTALTDRMERPETNERPIEAKLGQESCFYFNREKDRWGNKKSPSMRNLPKVIQPRQE